MVYFQTRDVRPSAIVPTYVATFLVSAKSACTYIRTYVHHEVSHSFSHTSVKKEESAGTTTTSSYFPHSTTYSLFVRD